jgi:hypothetical protein
MWGDVTLKLRPRTSPNWFHLHKDTTAAVKVFFFVFDRTMMMYLPTKQSTVATMAMMTALMWFDHTATNLSAWAFTIATPKVLTPKTALFASTLMTPMTDSKTSMSPMIRSPSSYQDTRVTSPGRMGDAWWQERYNTMRQPTTTQGSAPNQNVWWQGGYNQIVTDSLRPYNTPMSNTQDTGMWWTAPYNKVPHGQDFLPTSGPSYSRSKGEAWWQGGYNKVIVGSSHERNPMWSNFGMRNNDAWWQGGYNQILTGPHPAPTPLWASTRVNDSERWWQGGYNKILDGSHPSRNPLWASTNAGRMPDSWWQGRYNMMVVRSNEPWTPAKVPTNEVRWWQKPYNMHH